MCRTSGRSPRLIFKDNAKQKNPTPRDESVSGEKIQATEKTVCLLLRQRFFPFEGGHIHSQLPFLTFLNIPLNIQQLGVPPSLPKPPSRYIDGMLLAFVFIFMQMAITPWRDLGAPNSSVSSQILPRNQTIILVEDQSDLRWLLKRRLEINGYTCLEAANGREALSLIQQHPSIRLILSDYMMPEMNGLQRLHVLRQAPMNRKIPFILITASWSDQLQHQVMRAGAFAILAKPYHHGELVELLEQGLSTQAA